MTQSGQGEEPSARPAREGIVLPSDGGEPLLPGMTGTQGGGQRYGHQAPPAPAAPPGGQAWDGSWGPEQQQAPAQGQGWTPPPAQTWGTPSQPLPPENTPYADRYAPPSQGTVQPPAAGQYGYGYGTQGAGDGGAGAPLPPPHGTHTGGAPLPPAVPYGATAAADDGATQYIPPVADAGQGDQATQYIPPVMDTPPGDQATQYIPPVADAGQGDQATQYIPPVTDTPPGDQATAYLPPVGGAPVDDGATQYIPPVGSGALPPEVRAETPAESTQALGRVRRPGPGDMPSAAHSDADATQYIPPVTGGGQDRQTPAEFDNLFRTDPGGESPAASTQQMPRFEPHRQHAPHGAQQAPIIPRRAEREDREEPRGRGGRTGSRVPLFAAAGVAIAVVGIGAGALLGGGGAGDQGDDNKTVAAAAPASESASPSPSPSVDPAEQQAVELDKLLAVSGNSRTMVINAVSNVRSCTNLGQAAKDLRDAAKQRNDLVTELSKLSVDELPEHVALTEALTKAWQASASADNHYAAWAEQVAQNKRKLCRKGQARSTGQTQAGNQASGTASSEKAKASGLWNTIAKTYGLTERQPVQL
ncbi:hypothetical protein [Streptomyces sp. CC219B]|uniref:hypothetical protein n=1 Tax=Streptomyces sp. CC219B TaxID=3044574 RepID=UPI0024A7EBC3|nr:hypothetical protein [Streptomyces sp. CC219B]